MTGYSVAEYIRNRRLYLAAMELKSDNAKVIDVAYDFGYETPESFTKAFTRFHGVSPTDVKQGSPVKIFLPLSIKIDITGGDKMDVKIRNLFGFKVIGFAKEFSYETAYEEIPKYWDEICEKYTANVYAGNPLYEFPQDEWAIFDCVGAIPNALQSLNTRIFKEWLSGNPDYEISGNANVEWYDCMNGEKTDPDYHSTIWIPVKRK